MNLEIRLYANYTIGNVFVTKHIQYSQNLNQALNDKTLIYQFNDIEIIRIFYEYELK